MTRQRIIRGTPLNYPIGVTSDYQHAVLPALESMAAEVEHRIEALYRTPQFVGYFAQDAEITEEARVLLAALVRQFSSVFETLGQRTADRLASGANSASKSALRTSLRELAPSVTLDPHFLTGHVAEALAATVEENVGLIKSISSRYLDQVSSAVMRSITNGNGLADLVPLLREQHGVAKRRAEFIAYDQTRKAYGNLNVIRAKDAGLEEFEWLHSGGGQHPRKDHVAMSGKIFRLDDPPVIDQRTGERGFPGQAPGCRCRMCLVVKF